MIIKPNQIQAFSTPGAAWRWACDLITSYGRNVETEDGQKTKEIMNLVLQIENPLTGWPIDGSGWDIPALDVYFKKEILSSDNETVFDYTYGERLRKFTLPGIHVDQINILIHKLKENQTTRRAIAVTWDLETDNDQSFHPPCLIVTDFVIRGEALHLTAFFRSWDVAQAAPQNIYGLAKLMEYVAEAVGVEVGSLTIMATSAHIYQL